MGRRANLPRHSDPDDSDRGASGHDGRRGTPLPVTAMDEQDQVGWPGRIQVACGRGRDAGQAMGAIPRLQRERQTARARGTNSTTGISGCVPPNYESGRAALVLALEAEWRFRGRSVLGQSVIAAALRNSIGLSGRGTEGHATGRARSGSV